jgi:hypothetical protein
MGTVLEMTLQRISRLALGLSLCAALAGCGAPLVQAALARAAGSSGATVAKPAKDGPQIAMTLVSRGIKFSLQQLDAQDNIRLWAAADGAQVALRDGVLISTRGFGMDLMSADVPSVAALVGGGSDHSRTHHYLDGNDTPIRRSYTCSVAVAAADEKMPDTRHLQESCRSDAGRITNDYWLSGANRIIKSRQWVSQGVGYAIFDTTAQ